jgi:hypothetical protein
MYILRLARLAVNRRALSAIRDFLLAAEAVRQQRARCSSNAESSRSAGRGRRATESARFTVCFRGTVADAAAAAAGDDARNDQRIAKRWRKNEEERKTSPYNLTPC